MKEINKLYIAYFFYGFSSMATFTFTLFFLLNGLTQTQIAILFSIFVFSLALLEIPTGGYADTLGHKKSVFIGLLLESLYFLIFFFSTNFYWFVFGMLMAALGIAFQSGAVQALVYEILEKEKLTEHFTKIQGRLQSIFLLATIIAAPIGTLLYTYNPRTPYFLSFLFTLLTAMWVLFIKYEFTRKKPSASIYLHNITTGVHLTIKNNYLLGLIIIGLSLTLNRLLLNQNINQPYLLSIGIDVASIGIIAAIASAIMAVVTFYSHKILDKLGESKSLFLIVLLPSLCCIILSQINYLLGLVFIFVISMSHAFRIPVLTTLSQKHVTKEQRATMSSTSSFVSGISVGLLLPWWGVLIDKFGINITLLMLGGYTLLVGFTGFYIAKLNKD
jgi:MFS family permease